MNNQLATVNKSTQPQKASALAVMANRIQVEPDKLMATLKATVFSKASDQEMLALVVVANEYGLNPFLKELYAFPAKGGGIVPIVSIDGWNKMLIRQKDFDGIEFEMADGEDGKPFSCTATIYVKSRSKPVKVTEYYDECYRQTEPWNNMPRRMLRNRTLCQAARVAFGFAGVLDPDEAETVIEVTAPPPKRVGNLVQIADSTDKPSEIPAKTGTPQAELAAIVINAGHSFDDFAKWCKQEEQVKEIDSLSSFDDLKDADAKRLLRAQTGLLNGIAGMKEAA